MSMPVQEHRAGDEHRLAASPLPETGAADFVAG